jgi:chromosome partitioning protein
MIDAVLNPKGGFGKTGLVPRLVRLLARQGKRVTLIDAGPQGSALDWSEQCARRRFDHLFGFIGLARDALHREASQLARPADHIGIDGPPRVATLPRSALLTADLALIVAQPSTFDRWVSEEMLALIAEARIFCPPLTARFAPNRSPRTRGHRARDEAQPLRTWSDGALGTDRPVRDLRRRLARWPVRLRTRRDRAKSQRSQPRSKG